MLEMSNKLKKDLEFITRESKKIKKKGLGFTIKVKLKNINTYESIVKSNVIRIVCLTAKSCKTYQELSDKLNKNNITYANRRFTEKRVYNILKKNSKSLEA